MLDKDALSRLIDYTIWANHRVMRACATVPVDDFKRELGGSFGGIRGTLAHIDVGGMDLARALEGRSRPPARRMNPSSPTSSRCATAGR